MVYRKYLTFLNLHLIKQRLKDMVVCPINKNHLNRCFTKSLGRGQSAEAPPTITTRAVRAFQASVFATEM